MGLLKDDFTVFDVQKKLIYYAADMNWNYTLTYSGGENRIAYKKIMALVEYREEKGVGILLWYNSGGDCNTTNMSPMHKLLGYEDREKGV